MPKNPKRREIRRRVRNRVSNRLERRAGRFDQRVEEGTLTPEAAARRIGVAANRIGGRVGSRVASRLGAAPGRKRGERVAAATARPFVNRFVAPEDNSGPAPNPGRNRPARREEPEARSAAAAAPIETAGGGGGEGGGVDPEVFNALYSQPSGLIEAGARAAAQRRQRQLVLQRLLSLGDPRVLGLLGGI